MQLMSSIASPALDSENDVRLLCYASHDRKDSDAILEIVPEDSVSLDSGP